MLDTYEDLRHAAMNDAIKLANQLKALIESEIPATIYPERTWLEEGKGLLEFVIGHLVRAHNAICITPDDELEARSNGPRCANCGKDSYSLTTQTRLCPDCFQNCKCVHHAGDTKTCPVHSKVEVR